MKEKLNDYNGAIADFTKVIQLSNDDLAYYIRGMLKIKMKQNDVGCEDLEIAEELGCPYSKELLIRHCQ